MTATRERIVESADTLFYETGFEATSFADIAATVGISRGNFYHHFKSKDDLLCAVIDLRKERTRAMLDEWETTNKDPFDRILCFANILMTNRTKIMAFGCPVGTLCAELSKLEHAARAQASEIFGLFRDWLEHQFRALGARDAALPLAMRILAWSQGVAMMATAFGDEAFIREEISSIRTWLKEHPDIPSTA